MSIVLERVSKRYDTATVVDDISLDIADRELFVLVGPSGSGKSTILRMIAGLTDITSGRIWLHGRDVTQLAPQDRGVGFVFQHYALFPNMTVADNVEFGLRVQHVPAQERKHRRDELLALVGLTGMERRLPRQLSGGQQQRIALARAIAPRPAVLVLDEPFGALDAQIRIELRRNLRQIQRELGITAIFVTHDQDEAFELGDRIGIMHDGKLLEIGKPEDLYLNPQTSFAASFIGVANVLDAILSPEGVRIGTAQIAIPVSESQKIGQQVQLVLRPEDVTLTTSADVCSGTLLGQGVVAQQTFVGAFERLYIQVIQQQMVSDNNGTHDTFSLEAIRPQEQIRQMPLRPGDVVWIGISRLHILPESALTNADNSQKNGSHRIQQKLSKPISPIL
jgi:sulfate transport system ATP-binding protein